MILALREVGSCDFMFAIAVSPLTLSLSLLSLSQSSFQGRLLLDNATSIGTSTFLLQSVIGTIMTTKASLLRRREERGERSSLLSLSFVLVTMDLKMSS
jgi:hypothetical protein